MLKNLAQNETSYFFPLLFPCVHLEKKNVWMIRQKCFANPKAGTRQGNRPFKIIRHISLKNIWYSQHQLRFKRNSVNTKETWMPGPFSGHLRALPSYAFSASPLCPVSLCWSLRHCCWLFYLEETHCPLVVWMETHRFNFKSLECWLGKDIFAGLMK